MTRVDRRRGLRLGRWGELIALVLLTCKGYRLRHRNWQGAGSEIDLVMERRGKIVFVEVKTRSSDLYGGAEGAVDAAKRAALLRASSAYLSTFELWKRPTRIDVVTIFRGERYGWRVRHLRDAVWSTAGRQTI